MGAIDAGTLSLFAVTVLTLVFLEGLLSADNALVLAVMVRHLDKPQQKRALRYGIWGAFAFRLIAVLLANALLKFWFLKVAGGAYLLYLAASHFLKRGGGDDDAGGKRFGKGFWPTVLSVELADIAFSIDSILAAVAMAESLPADKIGYNGRYLIVVTGGILGIITMRFVAGYFIQLLDRFKGLESGAYALVAWIGAKLLTGGLHRAEIVPFEMNEWVFWGGMIAIVLASLVYRPKPGPPDPKAEEAAKEVARIASGEDGGSVA